MIYLILDTNNWIYLANGLDPIKNKYHDSLHYELLETLKDLKNNDQIRIIVNDIIIAEWDRNKAHCFAKIQSLENKLKDKDSAFKDIVKYAKAVNETETLKNHYIQGLESEILLNKKHIQNVEDFLLNDCIKVGISQKIKLQIFDLSINNLPPFHNKKNNVGDAAILLSGVEYLKSLDDLSVDTVFFISNNIEEYTDGKNLKDFHPQLYQLLENIDIKFERILPAALNISKEIILNIEQFWSTLADLADLAVKQFTWDLDKKENGTLMFLDVVYQNIAKNQPDYLTICVAKENGKSRPRFISFILPEYINKELGIYLLFVNKNGNQEIKEANISVNFESISEETCTARIWNGYVKNTETGIDIDVFQKFLEYDSFFVMYFNDDLPNQSISIPLFSFKQQYSMLTE